MEWKHTFQRCNNAFEMQAASSTANGCIYIWGISQYRIKFHVIFFPHFPWFWGRSWLKKNFNFFLMFSRFFSDKLSLNISFNSQFLPYFFNRRAVIVSIGDIHCFFSFPGWLICRFRLPKVLSNSWNTSDRFRWVFSGKCVARVSDR